MHPGSVMAGIAGLLVLLLIWGIRRFQAEPPVQWALKGAVLVGVGAAVGWFACMIAYTVTVILCIPGYEFGGKPPDVWMFAYVGIAAGGAMGWAVLAWLLRRQQREREG